MRGVLARVLARRRTRTVRRGSACLRADGGRRPGWRRADWRVFRRPGQTPGWLTAAQRARLSPAVTTALSAGWTPGALAAFAGANTDGVRSPYAVLANHRYGPVLTRASRAGRSPARSTVGPGWQCTTSAACSRPQPRRASGRSAPG